MNIKSNVMDAVIYMACSVPLVILIVLMLWWLADRANVVANEVANNVANRVPTIETEVYRVVCVEPADGYCKEYAVRRITKE